MTIDQVKLDEDIAAHISWTIAGWRVQNDPADPHGVSLGEYIRRSLAAQGMLVSTAPPKPCEHSEAISLAAHALRHAPNACPFHGVDFGFLGMQHGEPRCDSCKQPYRVARALVALRPTPSGGTAPTPQET